MGEPRRASRAEWWITAGVLLAGVGAIAYACAVAVNHACYHAPPPVSIPVAGTPRAGYCDRVESLHLWWFLIGAPVLVTCIAFAAVHALRRRVPLALGLATLIALATIANAIVANQLEWSITF